SRRAACWPPTARNGPPWSRNRGISREHPPAPLRGFPPPWRAFGASRGDSISGRRSRTLDASGRLCFFLRGPRSGAMKNRLLLSLIFPFPFVSPMKIPALRLAVALLAATAMPFAAAQDGYPNKPVRFVNNFPAGGPSDLLARSVAQVLQETLKQPFVVENKA